MNGEIKFRGYNYRTRTMHYFQYPGMVNGGPYHPGCLYCYECGCYVEPEDIDLMRFTGLRARNGLTEIYEEDIVELATMPSPAIPAKGKIMWLEEWAGFAIVGIGVDLTYEVDMVETVIGNIYENPELLEGRNGGS